MPATRDPRGRPHGVPRQPHPGGPRMPHRTRAEERIDEIDISPTKLLADIEQLRGELQATTAKADDYLAGLQRERAEFSNYRRRTREERGAMLGLAGGDLIRKLPASPDHFDLPV